MESVNATSFRVASHCVGHTTTTQSGNLPSSSSSIFHLLLSGWYRRVYTLLLEGGPQRLFPSFFLPRPSVPLSSDFLSRPAVKESTARLLLFLHSCICRVSEVDDNIETSLESRAESSLVYRRETIIFHPRARNPLEQQQQPASPAVYRRWNRPTNSLTDAIARPWMSLVLFLLTCRAAPICYTLRSRVAPIYTHTHTHTCLCFLYYSCWSNGPSKTSKGSTRIAPRRVSCRYGKGSSSSNSMGIIIGRRRHGFIHTGRHGNSTIAAHPCVSFNVPDSGRGRYVLFGSRIRILYDDMTKPQGRNYRAVTARFEKKKLPAVRQVAGVVRMSLIVYMYTGKTLNAFWLLFYFIFFEGFILCQIHSTLLHIFVLSCTLLRYYSCRLHVGSAVYIHVTIDRDSCRSGSPTNLHKS